MTSDGRRLNRAGPERVLGASSAFRRSPAPLSKVSLRHLIAALGALMPAMASIASDGLVINFSRPFFNPTLGEAVQIVARTAAQGSMSVTILDPDGVPVRRLTPVGATSKEFHLSWDGRDESQEVVPDEAYTMSFELTTLEQRRISDPIRKHVAHEVQVTNGQFDRQRGVISYQLPQPSRVRVIASAMKPDGSGRVPRRTIVSWEPRMAGAVVEQWNGYDESSTVNLLELPDSTIQIEARSLPGNVLITVGNRNLSYRDWAARRAGASHRTPRK